MKKFSTWLENRTVNESDNIPEVEAEIKRYNYVAGQYDNFYRDFYSELEEYKSSIKSSVYLGIVLSKDLSSETFSKWHTRNNPGFGGAIQIKTSIIINGKNDYPEAMVITYDKNNKEVRKTFNLNQGQVAGLWVKRFLNLDGDSGVGAYQKFLGTKV